MFKTVNESRLVKYIFVIFVDFRIRFAVAAHSSLCAPGYVT